MALKDKLKEVKDKFKQTEEPGKDVVEKMEYVRQVAKEKTTQVKNEKG